MFSYLKELYPSARLSKKRIVYEIQISDISKLLQKEQQMKIDEQKVKHYIGEFLWGQENNANESSFHQVRILAVEDMRFMVLDDILLLPTENHDLRMLERDVVIIHLFEGEQKMAAVPEATFYDYLECIVKRFKIFICTDNKILNNFNKL